MRLTRHDDADDFLARASTFLAAREAEHNLILGIGSRLQREPLLYGEPAYLVTVENGGRVVGVSMRTPPHNLIVSEIDDEHAIPLLLEDARGAFGTLPGVVGPKAPAAEFAGLWQEATGASARVEIEQRCFRADHVEAPANVSGAMRDYEPRDRELAVRWMDAFVDEALHGPEPESSAEFVDRRSEDPDAGLVVWEDGGEPVSFAGFGGRTPNGIRIGPVYTPPELRGRGYASALTAALTQRLLGEGRRFCFLFTDLANPTSNSIYHRIGYRPVSDVDLWTFSA
ncbi:MAG TPA: GNAT family N-acetyltransferase [Gaiellaceae bacterium]|nr:GNAT family N-acetyltransferase [Gaiellaceae bacterium]